MLFSDIFNMSTISNYSNRRQAQLVSKDAYLGELLFPSIKQDELDITDIEGANEQAVEGTIVSFNAESGIMDERALNVIDLESHKISNKVILKEKKVIELSNFLKNSTLQAIDKYISLKGSFIFNHVDRLILAVASVVEAMRMQVLMYGKIEKTEEKTGTKISLDYNRNAKNTVKLSGTKAWTDVSKDEEGEYKSNPLQDIEDMCNHLTSVSRKPDVIYCTTEAFRIFKNHPAVKRNVFADVNLNGLILSLNTVNAYLEGENLPQIKLYDEGRLVQKTSRGKVTEEFKKFLDTDVFVFAPTGELGTTVYTKTAEEIAYLEENSDAEEQVDNFIFTKYWTEDEPVQKIIKACAITVISCPFINSTGCIKIKE